jgi:hypothetical protein
LTWFLKIPLSQCLKNKSSKKVNGNKLCFVDETTEEQHEKGDMQLGICPLLPEVEREGFLASMKEQGFTNFGRFKDYPLRLIFFYNWRSFSYCFIVKGLAFFVYKS